MKVKRFYYIKSPDGEVLHMADSITESNPTYCGKSMWIGWKWQTYVGSWKEMPRCKRCLAKARRKEIHVARVRKVA